MDGEMKKFHLMIVGLIIGLLGLWIMRESEGYIGIVGIAIMFFGGSLIIKSHSKKENK